MTRLKIALASLLLVAGAGAAHAAGTTYTLDKNHTMVFASWDHFGFSRPSLFLGDVDGTLVYDPQKVEASSVQVTLPMSGLDALVGDFTDHLLSADFFDAAQYPNAKFRSTKVEKISDTKLKVTGDLTIRDVTKPVVLDVTLNKIGEGRNGAPKIGFDATTTIKRSEWGIAKYIPGSSDAIDIRISTEALGETAKAAP